MNIARIVTFSFYLLLVAPTIYHTVYAYDFNQNVFNSYCAYDPAARPSRFSDIERNVAYNRRFAADRQQNVLTPANNIYKNANGDEQTYSDYAGNFTKGFEHDLVTGALTAEGRAAYEQLVLAMHTGLQADFNAISLAGNNPPYGPRKLINPQLGLAFSNEGCDSSMFNVPPAPTLGSAEEAAEMIELYLQAVCRDVSFDDYASSYSTLAACDVLSALPAFTGPRDPNGDVTPQTLFRGNGDGCIEGPFISQFMLLDVFPLFAAGCGGPVSPMIGVYQSLIQTVFAGHQVWPYANLREFGMTWNEFVTLQNGTIPRPYVQNDFPVHAKIYLANGRELCYFVHTDGPITPYTPVINILAKNGFPLSPTNPYVNGTITKEWSLITLGGGDIHTMLGSVFAEAMKAAWAQKWRVHRRLRPEVMGGWFDYSVSTDTNPYNLDETLFAPVIGGVNWHQLVLQHNLNQAKDGPLKTTYGYNNDDLPTAEDASTLLLSLPFPEGSPTHPAYPSGHATIAGAAITILKAMFDDTVRIDVHVQPKKVNPNDPTLLVDTTLDTTVGQELNKLAWDVAMGRDFAGIHWRSDAEEGIRLGEQVAIRWLMDHCRIYSEQTFAGFELTTYDGVRIRITQDSVIPV